MIGCVCCPATDRDYWVEREQADPWPCPPRLAILVNIDPSACLF